MSAWFLTSTFYGNWLPGDPRGSVTNVLDRRTSDPNTNMHIEHAPRRGVRERDARLAAGIA